jgi:hypothetical protein
MPEHRIHRPESTRGLPRRRRIPSLAVALATILAVALATAASAFWAVPGSGRLPAATGAPQPITLSAATPSAQLSPGGRADLSLTITNPNSFTVHVGTLSLDASQGSGGYEVDSGHAGCGVSVLGFAAQTNGTSGWSVPPRVGSTDGALTLDLPGVLAMGAGAASACQGASFIVYLSAGP